MSLNDFARSKGLGSYELSIGVLDKRTQKAEVFAVRTQEQWDIWVKEIVSQSIQCMDSRYIVKPCKQYVVCMLPWLPVVDQL